MRYLLEYTQPDEPNDDDSTGGRKVYHRCGAISFDAESDAEAEIMSVEFIKQCRVVFAGETYSRKLVSLLRVVKVAP